MVFECKENARSSASGSLGHHRAKTLDTMVRASISLVALALTTIVSALPRELRQVTCVSGLYIISARGSNEDAGEGKLGQVSTLIKNAVAGSTSVAVDYPAAIISLNSIYPESVNDGITDTMNKIQAYVGTCGSSSKIVLLGYSQGGNVMTDLLAGGFNTPGLPGVNLPALGTPAPMSSTYKPNSESIAIFQLRACAEFLSVVGVVVFGDPTFSADQSFNAGTSTNDGIFTRSDNGSSLVLLNTYSSILKSYCDTDDPFCADGLDESVHSNEVSNHAQDAANFIVSLMSQRQKTTSTVSETPEGQPQSTTASTTTVTTDAATTTTGAATTTAVTAATATPSTESSNGATTTVGPVAWCGVLGLVAAMFL